MANTATRHSHGRLRLSKTQKVSSVIIIASAFFIVEIAIGIKTRSLALIADAFHIFSDLLGYIAAWIAIRMSTSAKTAQFTYGYQRGEILGGFFNGAFLSALGVSVVLQSIERFTEPKDVNSPILIMIIGAAGIGSNILMAVIMGGHHGHEHGAPDNERHNDIMLDNRHRGHAHSRQERGQGHTHDVNIVGIFIHILGDAVNSLAVIVSGAIYYATGFIYADPIVSLLVGLMIIGTAIPLALRSGRLLLDGVPRHVDLTGVQEDIERITGEFSVHELHIWSLTQSKTLASMHISLSPESATRVLSIISEVKQCLHLWGIHAATIQPEIAPHAPPQMSETAPAADQTYSVAGVQPCQSKCDIDCVELTCCE